MAPRKPKQQNENFVKALNPHDADTKYLGDEPSFSVQPNHQDRGVALAKSFTWYSRFYDKKVAKDLLIQYVEAINNPTIAKTLRKVADDEIITTICWLARMNLRGLILTDSEKTVLSNEIERLVKSVFKPEVKVQSVTGKNKDDTVSVNRPNVQEIMKEKTREAAGELEFMLDTFIKGNCKSKESPKIIDELTKRNILPQHVPIITDIWKKHLQEFEQVLEAKDSQLVQGYAHLGKQQIKNIIKFIEQVLSELNSYISIKKAAKAPRARKVVPIDKQVKNLKYLKEFKDDKSKLNLTSLSPVKLYGASEAWVYDVSKRKLIHFVADEYSKTFTVKGNTLLGFDNKLSETKVLRRPTEQIKEIMGSKPAARKYFKEIRAVSSIPNGRFNESMVILKAF